MVTHDPRAAERARALLHLDKGVLVEYAAASARRAAGGDGMKYLPLLLANLTRKKIRTVLTVGSFAVALFLFGLLGAIRAGFRQGIDVAGADRLVVIGRTSIIQPLPLAYLRRG